MKNNMPRTPFSTPLSGSARETEIRIRNIMSGPKKRPPVLFLALMFSVCIFCGNLVSCHNAEPEETVSDSSQTDSSADQEPVLTAQDLHPDLNQNGIPEEVRLTAYEGPYDTMPVPGEVYPQWEVQFWEGDEKILWRIFSDSYYLCTLDGIDYLLSYVVNEEQGNYLYCYYLARFDGEFEETQQRGTVSFDTNFNTLYHKEFDPKSIAAFVDEFNELLEHSVLLTVVDGELLAERPQPETLPWLDNFSDVFTRDPDKSLLENLRDFRAAMPQDLEPPVADGTTLPLDQPIELTFSSGAGAWWTVLTLHGDGTFQGDYEDADMDIHYVCQFHGRLGNIAEASETSFYMTLEELVIDTKLPVGQEWDEGSIHYISSEPYGFTGEDGKALEPGAGFVFYLPNATGHAPGTDLYGAYEFWIWWPNRHELTSAADTLGCYGLHNLASGQGFFS